MLVSAKHLLTCAIVLALGHSISAEYDVNAYCTLVKNGVKLASIDSCQDFYVCTNGVATKQSCATTQSFDKNSQSCRASSTVECYYGVSQPCVSKQNGYVPDVKTCGGWISCSNFKEVGHGTCGPNMVFQDGECRWGSCSDGGKDNEAAILSSVCEIMPNGRYFGSTLSCATWQVCTSKGLQTGDCSQTPNKLVYDVQNNLCNYEAKGMCSRVTYENIQPDEDQQKDCTLAEQGQLKASLSICSVYFTCNNKKWVKNLCPNSQYFDNISLSCKSRQTATPIASCNRCEGTNKIFVNAVDPACMKYLVCTNGAKTNDGMCSPNYYFNELSQACVFGDPIKSAYTANNGACAPSKNTGICSEESGTCTCTDPTALPCACGSDGIVCDVCPNGANNGMCIPPIDCTAVCSSANPCAPDSNCKCGYNVGVCTDCGAFTCDDKAPVDCTAVCFAATPCAPDSGCKCSYNEGVCTDCDVNTCDGCNTDKTICEDLTICQTDSTAGVSSCVAI